MTTRLFVEPQVIGICLGCWNTPDADSVYMPNPGRGERVDCDCYRPSTFQARTYTKRRAYICPTQFCSRAYTERMTFLEHQCEGY